MTLFLSQEERARIQYSQIDEVFDGARGTLSS